MNVPVFFTDGQKRTEGQKYPVKRKDGEIN